jgi:hypothetical protein
VHPGNQLGRQAAIRFDAVGGSSNQPLAVGVIKVT